MDDEYVKVCFFLPKRKLNDIINSDTMSDNLKTDTIKILNQGIKGNCFVFSDLYHTYSVSLDLKFNSLERTDENKGIPQINFLPT